MQLGFVRRLETVKHLYRVDSVGGALKAGMVASLDLIKQLYVTLKRLFTGDVSARNLGGIIQIAAIPFVALARRERAPSDPLVHAA